MKWMRQSLLCKIVAFLLAAAALVGLVFSGVGVIYNLDSGAYTLGEQEYLEQNFSNHSFPVAYEVLRRYVQREFGSDDPYLETLDFWWDETSLVPGVDYEYEILTLDGKRVDSNRTDAPAKQTAEQIMSANYYKAVPYVSTGEDGEEFFELSEQEVRNGWYYAEDYVNDNGQVMRAIGKESGRYLVRVFFLEAAEAHVTGELIGTAGYWAYQNRTLMLWVLAGSAVLLLLMAVYLAWAVDHSRKSETIVAYGIHRVPLDLSCIVYAGLGGILTMIEVDYVAKELYEANFQNTTLWGIALTVAALGSMMILDWFLSLVAQFKQGGGFWWRNSLTGRVLLWAWKWVRRWLLVLQKAAKRCWDAWALVPLIWHWVAAGIGFLLVLLLGFAMESGFLVVLDVLAAGALIFYNGVGYGMLLRGVQRMRQGHLEEKVELGRYAGQYRIFAENLNSMADAAMEAARKQTASERMRTELITNVSHDIKTPLTSIVNYVDLLQKPHTEEEGQRYLEVLNRQSLRMKKLVEDLVEMSKAATGNLPVELTRMDAVEALHQALGEFAERLERVPLELVLQVPAEPVMIRADGRLIWRVLSNLLSNTVKYAMPGTRFYVTLTQSEGLVLISLKNISRDPLNISAEELMERFVRGDTSRNTEGSGLGLNIAQSLMEVQHGSLELTVDGDLFKATILLPTN